MGELIGHMAVQAQPAGEEYQVTGEYQNGDFQIIFYDRTDLMMFEDKLLDIGVDFTVAKRSRIV